MKEDLNSVDSRIAKQPSPPTGSSINRSLLYAPSAPETHYAILNFLPSGTAWSVLRRMPRNANRGRQERRNFNKKSHLRRIASGSLWRRRELHPRPRFRKPFHSMILASKRDAPWLHYVCADAALRELVASWQRLTPSVKSAILSLLRGG